MKQLIFIITCILAGCSSEPTQSIANEKPMKYQLESFDKQKESDHSVSYYDKPLIKNVNHYVNVYREPFPIGYPIRQLAIDLYWGDLHGLRGVT